MEFNSILNFCQVCYVQDYPLRISFQKLIVHLLSSYPKELYSSLFVLLYDIPVYAVLSVYLILSLCPLSVVCIYLLIHEYVLVYYLASLSASHSVV